ncbi:MAG: hypothetical protein B6D42_12130 [Anaerolineae bacterium UTCFX5]|nr:MAG: hypothetical protein B6D42_12130 [Anaerolineae bacterium UTCFX5]
MRIGVSAVPLPALLDEVLLKLREILIAPAQQVVILDAQILVAVEAVRRHLRIVRRDEQQHIHKAAAITSQRQRHRQIAHAHPRPLGHVVRDAIRLGAVLRRDDLKHLVTHAA